MLPPLPGETTWLGGIGAVVGAAALAVVGGTVGIVAGVLVVVTWFTLSDLAAYALGYVVLGAVLTNVVGAGILPRPPVGPLTDGALASPFLQGGLVSLALLPLLLGPVVDVRRPVVLSVVTVAFGAMVAVVALAPVLAGGTVWLGSVVLIGVTVLLAYALHRYGLLVSGVLSRG